MDVKNVQPGFIGRAINERDQRLHLHSVLGVFRGLYDDSIENLWHKA